jgi:hypothetical protein
VGYSGGLGETGFILKKTLSRKSRGTVPLTKKIFCYCFSVRYGRSFWHFIPVSSKNEGAKEQGYNKETATHTSSNVNPFLIQAASLLTSFLALKQVAWKHMIKYQPMTSKKRQYLYVFMFSTYISIIHIAEKTSVVPAFFNYKLVGS